MTDKPQDPLSKKIIIDEDWKSRIEAEKEQMEHPEPSAERPESTAQQAAADEPLPPPSLESLVTSFALQATSALGLAPNRLSSKIEMDLNEAKYFIDMIDMLYEKSQGNRTPGETAVLESMLHELRLGYVTMLGQAQKK